MTKRKKYISILILALLILSLFGSLLIIKNNFFSTNYDQLNKTDREMLAEYNRLYEKIAEDNLWADFDLADKTILALPRGSLNAYLINSKDFIDDLFAQKITMPNNFKLRSVYRIVPIVPEILKIRLDVFSNFNTIDSTHTIFNNNIYYIKYDNSSFKKVFSSTHFSLLLAHESFHYYMQNNWKILNIPENTLSEKDINILKEEYDVLDKIRNEISLSGNKEKLIYYSKQYVDIVSRRIMENKEYVLSEISKETAEGTAQYLTIKTAKLIGYDYGVMYFDNKKNVPFSEVYKQLEAGNLKNDFLYSRMPYETGAQLCFLFDALNIPNWQKKLNNQTLEKPINLYDILRDYLTSL